MSCMYTYVHTQYVAHTYHRYTTVRGSVVEMLGLGVPAKYHNTLGVEFENSYLRYQWYLLEVFVKR